MASMMSMIPEGLLLAFRTRHSLVLENLTLRHQIVVLQRSSKRPRLKMRDRVFWVPLRRILALMLLAATLRAKVREKWANEITWMTAERIRFGQPLDKGSLRSAGMACRKASGREETGGYGKFNNDSKLAVLGREPKNR